MSIISPILGAGQIYNSSVLRGNTEVQDFADADTKTGIELQFYSNSGELVGVVGSQYEKSNLVNLEIVLSKIGDLISFKFQIGRKVDIPFFNNMETRFYYNGIHWFSGILTIEPDQGRRNVQYEYDGKGFIDYTNRVSVDETYLNDTLTEIAIDLIQTYLAPNSRVLYNASLIDLPDTTVTKLQLKNKKVKKGLDEILKIANTNFKTVQYRYGVNKYREFFFLPISSTVIFGFFEGHQFQEPDIENDVDDLANQIRLYRAQDNSQVVEEIPGVSPVQDLESIDTWDVYERPLVISDYVDTTTAVLIANYLLERFSNPLKKIDTKNIVVEDIPYPFGFYSINTRHTEYITPLSDFENTGAWTLNISDTTITETTEKTVSKNRAFKIELANGSVAENMEFELDDALYFPVELVLYVNVNLAGAYFDVIAIDDDGNEESLGSTLYRITHSDAYRVTESGAYRVLSNGVIRIDIVDDFIRLELPITTLDNLKKVKILFVSNEEVTIYMDRLDLETYAWKQDILTMEKIKYNISKANIKADIMFGEETKNLVDKIKKLDDKSDNILNIFKKG